MLNPKLETDELKYIPISSYIGKYFQVYYRCMKQTGYD